jgi:3-oxoacyl-[acyl-carrier-protein] synthase III
MDAEKHLELTGGLMMNLQAVETLLRYFLVLREGQSTAFPKVGDTQADETFATNYTSLGELIDVYNVGLTAEEAHRFKVDRQIVHIRDAFAHGRLVTEKEFPVTLWKFGRAKNGKVAIEFSETLTEEWLKNANKLLVTQRDRIVECAKARGYKGLS